MDIVRPHTSDNPIGPWDPPRPLGVAVVGCGRVAETCHIPALRSLGRGVKVTAVADVDSHRRRRVAGMFDIPHVFADADVMLRDADEVIDVVAVCAPATFHADAVIAALDANKHVLVEKPLALTLSDAQRIATRACAAPHLKVLMGFNLRHHRLVERARRMILNGVIGPVNFARTVWSSGIRLRTKLPEWRNSRTTSGGVFAEIAVHHIDLLRYLTGCEITECFAQSQHGEGDDESATLSLKFSSGAAASCVFSERSADVNELELFGPKGRLAFSIYHFDSLSITAPGQYGGRAGRAIETLMDLPRVWPILRRGGDFRETYRREWLSFFDSIERDTPVSATIEDGLEAVRVVLAAGASANSGRPAVVAEAPNEPQPAAERPSVNVITSSDPASDSRPALTAILATRSGFDSIRHIVQALRAQTIAGQIELMIVRPAGVDLTLDLELVDGFHSCRVIELGDTGSLARANANAAGIRAAAAPVVVLCEDHAFPDPRWAEALLIAHRGPYAAVGPVVYNANPSTAISWADCLIGYGPWLAPLRPGEPSHLPGHNSSYKRDILLSYGERLDDMMEAETVLHWDLRGKGHRLYLDPMARLAHTNFAQLGVWTKVQFHAGRVFAATRAISWPMWKQAIYGLASPLIPLVRLKRVVGHARRIRAAHAIPLTVWPALLWGLAIDGLGQFAGYVTGAGASRRKVAEYEFERSRFITEADRQKLAAAQPAPTGP